MGLLQASAADGMAVAGMDRGVSADQLVVSVVGARQFGVGIVGGRSDFAPLRKRRQKNGRAVAADAAADLPASRPALQCQRGVAGDLADRDLLLPAVVRNARDPVGRRRWRPGFPRWSCSPFWRRTCNGCWRPARRRLLMHWPDTPARPLFPRLSKRYSSSSALACCLRYR